MDTCWHIHAHVGVPGSRLLCGRKQCSGGGGAQWVRSDNFVQPTYLHEVSFLVTDENMGLCLYIKRERKKEKKKRTCRRIQRVLQQFKKILRSKKLEKKEKGKKGN